MKLMRSFTLAPLLATVALAQNIAIGAPAANTSLSPGSSFVVEVDRPNSLTGSQELVAVIALNACSGSAPCNSPQDVLGHILYNGSFNPQYSTPADSKPPHQNFTVTVPGSVPTGRALLSVTHLALVGAGPYPYLEIENVTVNIAA